MPLDPLNRGCMLYTVFVVAYPHSGSDLAPSNTRVRLLLPCLVLFFEPLLHEASLRLSFSV